MLLIRDKSKRLGAKSGADEILAHKFFKGVNVKKILEHKFKAPYIPQKSDISIITIDKACEKLLLEQDEIPDPIKKLID
jgi:serum/glucocorticoid-regulated kinase 2